MQDSFDSSGEPENVSIDDWKPSHRGRQRIIQSEWRKRQIAESVNVMPSLCDLRKIESLMKKDVTDAEIMQVFGISAEVMLAIRRGRYCPVEGVELDILGKIYKEFSRIEQKVDALTRGMNYISKCMFTDKDAKAAYKKALQKQKSPSHRKQKCELEHGEEE